MARTVDRSGAANNNYKGLHRKCKQCAGPINGSSATRKFCDRDCQAASYRTADSYKTCPWCAKDFYHRTNTCCTIDCAKALRVRLASNPGDKAARKLRKESGLFTGLLGRPPGPKQPRVCSTCAKGFLVRASETDRKYCSRQCYATAVSIRQQGVGHHMYKHGLTKVRAPERQRLRVHKDYKAWRAAVFERDGFACRACRGKGDLNAHHHIAWTDDPKLRLKVSNGVALCNECHRLWHAYDRKGLFVGKESALQSKVVSALSEYGFYVYNVPGTPFGTIGIPDLVVCYQGGFGGLECKVFPNYLTAVQEAQAGRIKASGGIFMVVQSEDDIGRVIEAFELKRASGCWATETN
jgi:5-methylcytosine-specific restriction endonuclease McrA